MSSSSSSTPQSSSFQARVNSPLSTCNCCYSSECRPAVALIFLQTRRGQKDTCLQPMKAPSTASSSTLMSSILLPMTTCLKDQNCFKPQDGQILKQISEPTEIGLNSLVQTHIKIRCYEIRICHGASRGQCVQTRLGSNFTRFSIRNLSRSE